MMYLTVEWSDHTLAEIIRNNSLTLQKQEGTNYNFYRDGVHGPVVIIVIYDNEKCTRTIKVRSDFWSETVI